MKKILMIVLLAVMSFSSLFAVATVTDFFGKVKIKYDGDTKWSRITIGMELPANATVSTGFNSQIVLDLGNATLDVLPLTRMTISEITESSDTINTSLFLQGGKIIADVKKIEGKVNDFKIKSPVATASVRGTAFEFSGNTLKVIRGIVAFTPTKKVKAAVDVAVKDTEEAVQEVVAVAQEIIGVAVKAGGSTQMATSGSIPIKPKDMAKTLRSIEASTKPEVIKAAQKVAIDAIEGLSESPIPSAVQAALDGTTNITITINPIED